MFNFKYIVILVAVSALGMGSYLGYGLYDVSADTKHWGITEWVLGSVRDRSITTASSDIKVPTNLADQNYYVQAAGNYQEMCSGCHLAPGIRETELSQGLYPQPPDFTANKPDDPIRTFWVIKHGLKMTGMPAWGVSHSDEDIWQLVAFTQQLKGIEQRDYLEMVSQYSGRHTHADGGGHHREKSANTEPHRKESVNTGHHDDLETNKSDVQDPHHGHTH